MSEYTGELDSKVVYRDRMKYVTAKRHAYQTKVFPDNDIFTQFVTLLTCGVLLIDVGYAWNGANVVVDRRTNMRASLIHDALVQLIQDGKLDQKHKRDVDEEYYGVCRDDGMWLIPAWVEFGGVQLHSWEERHSGEIKVCP